MNLQTSNSTYPHLEHPSTNHLSLIRQSIQLSTSPKILLADIDETLLRCNVKWFQSIQQILADQYPNLHRPEITYQDTLPFGYTSSYFRHHFNDKIIDQIVREIKDSDPAHSDLELFDKTSASLIQEHSDLTHSNWFLAGYLSARTEHIRSVTTGEITRHQIISHTILRPSSKKSRQKTDQFKPNVLYNGLSRHFPEKIFFFIDDSPKTILAIQELNQPNLIGILMAGETTTGQLSHFNISPKQIELQVKDWTQLDTLITRH